MPRRYLSLSETSYLDIPIEHPIMIWWYECRDVELDARTGPHWSAFFDDNGFDARIQEVHTLHCEMAQPVHEWCDTALTAAPDILTQAFTILEEEVSLPTLDVARCHGGSTVRLRFVTDKDLVHFKLRWF